MKPKRFILYFVLFFLLGLTLTTATTPKPVFKASGVVNAASGQHKITTGKSMVSIYGTALASQTCSAPSPQLGTNLCGTIVYADGVAQKLLYVSATQVNIVLDAQTSTLNLRVSVDGTDSDTVSVTTSLVGFELLVQGGTADNAAAVHYAHPTFPDWSNIDSGHAVEAGQWALLFGTGIMDTRDVQVLINGVPCYVDSYGHQGQYEGLDQINIKIPATVGGECSLVVVQNGIASRPRTIWVVPLQAASVAQ